MLIHLKTSGSPQILIFPIEQGEHFADRIARVAERAGIDPSILDTDFKGNAKEVHVLYTAASSRIYLLGLGKNPKFNDFISIFRSFFYKNKGRLTKSLGIDFTSFEIDKVEAIVNGIVLGNNNLGNLHKTEKEQKADFYIDNPQFEIYVDKKNIETANKLSEIGHQTALTQHFILDLVNQPSNFKTPAMIAHFALKSGQKHGFETKIYDEAECKKQGLAALLAVSKGSENPPVFIIMEYKPENPVKKIGLVGKGVSFDTGGISIKSSNGMSYMKSDMGGAAAVIGTMELVAKLKLPIHLIGIVPSTENTVDGNAIKPGFVIDSYAGKTIEVIDTDAEGRLILADGLNYMAKNFEPEIMIDLATLTGNIIAALGYSAAGLFTNNQDLANDLLKAGTETGERLWQMPMFEEFGDAMKSDIADIKNLSSNPVGGAITATKFLEVFTDKHPAWAHLDIAGTAFGDSEYGSMKSATAFGVNLLSRWMRNMVEH